jgi:two-component system, cell cycle response regulator DivK
MVMSVHLGPTDTLAGEMSETASPLREPRDDDEAPYAPRARRLGRILIVDDFPDAVEMYRMYLTHFGYEVISAEDGSSAVAMALRLVPDVIVMDLSMPRMDGIQAIGELKGQRRTRHIPIILLTGFPERAINEGALEAGADVFLTKPCLPDDLEGHVRRLIQGRTR